LSGAGGRFGVPREGSCPYVWGLTNLSILPRP
jgi:hypothetical protein